MRSRIWIVLLVASLGVNIGLLLHWAWPKLSSARHAGPMKQVLGLSSEQALRLESDRRQVMAQAKPLQDALRQKRRELFLLLKKPEVTDAELDPILGEISRLQAAIEKMFIVHSLRARGVFSPAQLRKYEDCLERELCPGMIAAGPCPPGKTGGRGMAGGACAGGAETKRQIQ